MERGHEDKLKEQTFFIKVKKNYMHIHTQTQTLDKEHTLCVLVPNANGFLSLSK